MRYKMLTMPCFEKCLPLGPLSQVLGVKKSGSDCFSSMYFNHLGVGAAPVDREVDDKQR